LLRQPGVAWAQQGFKVTRSPSSIKSRLERSAKAGYFARHFCDSSP